MNPDELEPIRSTLKMRDLQPMSIEDLQHYIATLEQEIARVEAAIARKEAHRSGIDALFGGSKS